MSHAIRQLAVDDALQLRSLRLHALKHAPDAFTVSYEEYRDLSHEDIARDIADDTYIGAFDTDGRLVGISAYQIRRWRKQQHQAYLFGVYVHPDARGQGLSARMLDACLAHARTRVEMMILQVAVTNFPARHTYLKAGFQSYGVEPKALKIGDDYIDEEHMWLDLTRWIPAG